MKQRNLFASDLLDLDCELPGIEVRRACRVAAVEPADDGGCSLKVPFEVVAKLRDEHSYAPATAGQRYDSTVLLRAYGADVLRLSVVPQGETATADSTMLQLDPALCQTRLTPEQTSTGWLIWARAGWAGCQRYPVHWGGDAECSWQGMAGSLRGVREITRN